MADEKTSQLKTALILGINSQDGNHLTKLLLEKSYQVYGTIRNDNSNLNEDLPFKKSKENFIVDITDTESVFKVVTKTKPDEIYNLAGFSSVFESFKNPELVMEVNFFALQRILDRLKRSNIAPDVKFYQASSSEMFGKATSSPQVESTPLAPVSPYAQSKTRAHEICQGFREEGMFITSGILYNHEGEYRRGNFVSRKITKAVSEIALGLRSEITLGNLAAERDWGYAGDYVEAMWGMLQIQSPEDFIVATGVSHSVEDFLKLAFDTVGLLDGSDKYVKIDQSLLRPTEVNHLVGNASKAQQMLGWKAKTSFESLVKLMVKSDLEILCRENNLEIPLVPTIKR